MSTNDYVKYVTQQIVSYVDKPKEERRAIKAEKKSVRLPFIYRWFGMVPLAFSITMKKRRNGNK
ncbi:YqzE family protein [Anaerobacillus sp. MEB173]|uniref:YqzE family protein n=1 Tax=Anaerobacillus sp. MEB173 TaxID=3383345 RepID=UPI003F9116D7